MYQQQQVQAITQEISFLSADELKELLNDDEKLDEKVNNVVQTLEKEKEDILNGNRSIAEENLSKEPEIIEKRGRINELTEEGKTLCSSVQEKLNEIKSKSGDKNQDTVLALLETAAAESEENSDKIVKQLMDKELSIDEFLDQFLTSRKTMHLRKIKSEKMSDLLRQQLAQQRGSTAAYPNINSNFYPTPPSNLLPYSSAGSSMPYPMGPIHMPMPGVYRQY